MVLVKNKIRNPRTKRQVLRMINKKLMIKRKLRVMKHKKTKVLHDTELLQQKELLRRVSQHSKPVCLSLLCQVSTIQI